MELYLYSLLHVSARPSGAIFRLNFFKKYCTQLTMRDLVINNHCHNTRSRNQQALSIVHITFLKKFSLKMAPDGRVETCSWEILLKIHFNNCLIESCVRLYILYYITIETQRGGLTWKLCSLYMPSWCGHVLCLYRLGMLCFLSEF